MKEEYTYQDELRRITELIQALQRVLGRSNRDLERELGVHPSYLSRVFNGTTELRLTHVLALSAALGLRWDEFFRIAYPSVPQPPSEAASELQRVFQDLDTTGASRRLPLIMDEVKDLVEDLIKRLREQ